MRFRVHPVGRQPVVDTAGLRKGASPMSPRLATPFTRPLRVSLAVVSLLLLQAALATAQPRSDQIEPRAGQWKTWTLSSGSELRLPAPPDAASTKAELTELRRLAGQRDAAAIERIRYWDFWSPSH